jgi:hypothetical protein
MIVGGLGEKVFDEFVKSEVIASGEAALEKRMENAPFRREQTKIAFCAANVTGKDHVVWSSLAQLNHPSLDVQPKVMQALQSALKGECYQRQRRSLAGE